MNEHTSTEKATHYPKDVLFVIAPNPQFAGWWIIARFTNGVVYPLDVSYRSVRGCEMHVRCLLDPNAKIRVHAPSRTP